ncbi:MAG: ABC transporter permease [Oscillospiraceae bacterium]|jgi:putative ABC transport system permease protein|nr:ABC transporter permease [Oscillospiraceae bacterium]
MKITQAIKMAFSAIAGNKMRSFLTMLGIIIGVLSVTLLISIVQGATGALTEEIEGIGGNRIIVEIYRGNNFITQDDLRILEEEESIAYVAPEAEGYDEPVTAQNKTFLAGVKAVTQNSYMVSNLELQTGRFISENDDDSRLYVAVVGSKVAEELFGHQNVVGYSINLYGRSFEIIGVMVEKGEFSMDSNDDTVYIPLSVGMRLQLRSNIRSFNVMSDSMHSADDAIADIDRFLKARIKTYTTYEGDSDEGFFIFNMGDILSAFKEIESIMSMVLGGIAGISLLVGGIGIMNIMLVSVTERTREIGIRKAIGAQHTDIMIQFLVEAMSISLTGGVIGMLLASLLLGLIGDIIDIKLSLSFSVAALAIIFSISIGMIFGLYPANKAAKLKPIDALRYE